MRNLGPSLTRRGILAGAVLGAATLTGCEALDRDPAPTPSQDPLLPVLTEALALAAAHERAAAARPDLATRLAPIAQAHRAHAAELRRLVAAPTATTAGPAGSASPGNPLPALRAAEQRAGRTAGAACRQAPAARAALLGSIAAARACHVEALR